MALYVPASSRRRRTIAIAVAALLVGLLAGLLVGRASAPGIGDRIASVREDARRTSAGLRVIVLHDQAGVGSAGADSGADLVLANTRTQLTAELDRAPWLGAAQRDALLHDLDALEALPDRTSASFGSAAEALAAKIDATFGA